MLSNNQKTRTPNTPHLTPGNCLPAPEGNGTLTFHGTEEPVYSGDGNKGLEILRPEREHLATRSDELDLALHFQMDLVLVPLLLFEWMDPQNKSFNCQLQRRSFIKFARNCADF